MRLIYHTGKIKNDDYILIAKNCSIRYNMLADGERERKDNIQISIYQTNVAAHSLSPIYQTNVAAHPLLQRNSIYQTNKQTYH